MFVGETGIRRVVERTCDAMAAIGTDDPERVRAAGVIDLPTLQRFLNFHYSVSLDLFGQERSTNAANYFTAGLKGRFQETRIDDDHRLTDDLWPVHLPQDGAIVCEAQPALLAINERLRDAFITDSQRGIDRWNRTIAQRGVDYRLTLPHRGFNRRIGGFADVEVSPAGNMLSADEWARQAHDWLPSEADHGFVQSLMKPVIAPGAMAGWINPPSRGINGQPIDFDYVRFGH